MTKLSQLIDPFNRKITYLRVSVTDRCDFRCVYCMSEKMQFLPKKDLLTLEELDKVCSVFLVSNKEYFGLSAFDINLSELIFIIFFKFFS